MPPRFCPQCGTKASVQAKFCIECGAGLDGTSAVARQSRPRTAGFTVFGGLLLVGLGIWAAILTPDPPPPALGGSKRPAPPPMAGGAAPPAGQKVELPDEIVKLVGDLAAKAAAKPDDLALWTHLGEVYSRTAQFDETYYAKALDAFDHVLARDTKRADAIRGKANVYYDRNEPKRAIPLYERYLALRGDDASVQTDLATMHFYDGDTEKAIGMYQAVLTKDPHFVQAHYNLAAAYHRQGNVAGALEELRTARSLATEDRVKEQIDQMIARLSGQPAPAVEPATAPATAPPAATAPATDASRTPFQREVETQLRAHQILGPRIVELRWKSAGAVEARMREFPMAQMPPMARQAFDKRVIGYLENARRDHPVEGPVSLTIVDAASGDVMATVAP